MRTRTDKAVIQMVPPVMTGFVKELLFSAYKKESELTGSINHDKSKRLDQRRLDIFPCSLNLIGDKIHFPQESDTDTVTDTESYDFDEETDDEL